MKRRANGTGGLNAQGYWTHSINNVRKRDHIRIAEAALGKPLPPGAVVHHWNEVRSDNAHANLVICPDKAYHALLHRRARALDACGHAHWRKCPHCKQYDDPANLKEIKNGNFAYHRACKTAYDLRHKRDRQDRESVRRRSDQVAADA